MPDKKKKKKKRQKPVKRRGFIRSVVWWFWYFVFGIAFICVGTVFAFKYIDPPHGLYILKEKARLGHIKQEWTPIEHFSRAMPLSVVVAEDAEFCLHNGFDVDAIKEAWEEGAKRGGSTISQQVAKNVFLSHDRSWVRKGLEAVFAALIEVIWKKERILEVYLNVAEFDEGVFGAAAGARHYFGQSPSNISQLQAARLAAILPNPKQRSARNPSKFVRTKTGRIMAGAQTIATDKRSKCF